MQILKLYAVSRVPEFIYCADLIVLLFGFEMTCKNVEMEEKSTNIHTYENP